MRVITILLFGITTACFFFSCDKIDKPYLQKKNSGPDTSDQVVRKILVEDFTGHKCGNCPEGHKTIQQLIDLYGEKIVPVSIHCGYYAVPNSSGTMYRYDFRTAVGNVLGGDGEIDYEGIYSIQAYPSGLVNSIKKEKIVSNSSWPSEAAAYLNSAPLLKIEIENYFSQSTGKTTSTIKTTAIESINKTLYLIVYVIEDSIKKWQTDYSLNPHPDDSAYIHRHVLRKGLNGHLGDQIKTGAFNKDEMIEKSYTLLFGSDWVPGRCGIIAFVYDAETKEVLQVEESRKFFVVL